MSKGVWKPITREGQHLTHFRLHSRDSLTYGAGLSAKVGLQKRQVKSHLGIRCSLNQNSIITTAATEQAEAGWLQSLYAVGQQADQLVQHQLTGVTSSTYVVVLAAGLLTSLSPCTLSVLPLTIGYIGGYSADKPSNNSILVGRAGAFALGLATTLALLGVLSSAVGNAYGQIGNTLPLGMTHWQLFKWMHGSKTGAGCYAHLHFSCIKLHM